MSENKARLPREFGSSKRVYAVNIPESRFQVTGSTAGVTGNPNTVLYVGGLDEQVTEATLHGAFVPFGNLVQVLIPRDHEKAATHRGFGFVEFEDEEDAQHAIDNMNDSELFGRVIKVNRARPNAMKSGAVWHDADRWVATQLKASGKEVDAVRRLAEDSADTKMEDD